MPLDALQHLERTIEKKIRLFEQKNGIRLDDEVRFIRSWLEKPLAIGAVTPSGRVLARTMARYVDPSLAGPVVELGPGTGSLSSGIHSRLPAGARHIGIELGETMVDHLRAHKPWMEIVHGDAGDLLALLDKRGVDRVDAVISSIPWSLLPDDAQDHILRQAAEVLTPQGAFTALTYLPADRTHGGRRFRKRLGETFDEVLTPTTWLNFPPILHYICRRPLK